jgi:hypothetical protein
VTTGDLVVAGSNAVKPAHGSGHLSRSYRPHSVQLLIARGADLSIRARVPGYHERPGEVLDLSGAEDCAIFPLRHDEYATEVVAPHR